MRRPRPAVTELGVDRLTDRQRFYCWVSGLLGSFWPLCLDPHCDFESCQSDRTAAQRTRYHQSPGAAYVPVFPVAGCPDYRNCWKVRQIPGVGQWANRVGLTADYPYSKLAAINPTEPVSAADT